MSNNMFSKFTIFNDVDQQLKNRIRLFFIAYQHLVFFITSDDEVFLHKVNDGTTRIDELCHKNIIKFESNGESNPYYMALSDTGSVYSWGYNSKGQLGHNTNKRCAKPMIINSVSQYHVIDMSCGYSHSLLITREGHVFACGYNAYGQCGNNNLLNQFIPIKIAIIKEKVVSIACGYNHSTALTDNGLVYVWGSNADAQLGISCVIKNQLYPTLLPIPKIKQVFCGTTYTLLLTIDGDIYLCGKISKGILHKNPKKMNTIVKFVEIFTSIRCHFFVALSDNGKCFIMGKCGNEKVKELKQTNHSTIEDAFFYYEQITCKLMKTCFLPLVNELNTMEGKSIKNLSDSSGLGSGYSSNVHNSFKNKERKLFDVKKVSLESKIQANETEVLEQLSKLKIETEDEIDSNRIEASKYKTEFTEECSLGTGGFSTVFKVRDNADNKLYAIKKVCFDTETRENVMKELEFLKLKSIFIVDYFNSWEEYNYYIGFGSRDDEFLKYISSGCILQSPNKPFLLHIQMELCSLTLRDVINILKTCITPENTLSLIGYYVAMELMIEILECVEYIHLLIPSIIHRDLKPENILLSNFGINRFVKLSDFGLSTFHEYADQSHTKNIGTNHYIAPEVKISRYYTTKSDIYSLGIIMQELLYFDFKRFKEYKEINPGLSPFLDWAYKSIIDMTFFDPTIVRPNCDEILAKRYNEFFQRDYMLEIDDVKRIINGRNDYTIEDNFIEFFICSKLKN